MTLDLRTDAKILYNHANLIILKSWSKKGYNTRMENGCTLFTDENQITQYNTEMKM